MELVRARPLDQVIAEDGPLPPARAAQLGLGLLDALTAAHEAGVLHRDVKPSNVLISPNGKAVLTDFGIATIQGDPGLTQAGMVVGTPGFSPPERIRGAAATAASDLWSLGATLYAAVEGRGPFDRAGGSAAIVASIATEPAPRAPSAGPLASVIEALLRADPAQRPDSATTARMLTQAWKSARAAARAGITVSPEPVEPGGESSGLAPNAGSEATTATQVVTVPPDPGSGSRELALDAAADADPADPASAGAGDVVAAAAATNVVPDLMATPIFADLKMPSASSTPDTAEKADNLGPTGPLGSAGSLRTGGGDGKRVSPRSRRTLLLVAPVVVLAIAVAVLFIGLPGIGSPFAGVGGSKTGQTPLTAAHVGHGGTGGGGYHSGSSGKPGAKGKSSPSGKPSPGRSSASGKPRPSGSPSASGKPKPSGKPSSSGKPTSSTTPTPSTSATPTPTPTPTQSSPASGGASPPGRLCVGPRASSGNLHGRRVQDRRAGGWAMTPALNTIIRPASGPGRLSLNLMTWTVPDPVKEARRLQAAAIASGNYPHYQKVSIAGTSFHGMPAARWIFSWKSATAIHRARVVELLFTWAGSQQYIMSISAPAPRAAWAISIFHVAMQTFRVLPAK